MIIGACAIAEATRPARKITLIVRSGFGGRDEEGRGWDR